MMTGASIKRALSGGRWQLVVIPAFFLVPTVLAWALLVSGWRPDGATTNHGTLIRPPIPVVSAQWHTRAGQPLPEDGFYGHWTLLLVIPGRCDAGCEALVDAARRVRVALNQDADRLRLLLLQPRHAPAANLDADDVVLAAAPAQTVQELARQAPVQLIDYQGFRMMAYSLPLNASGLLRDLEHLLRLSDEALESAAGVVHE